MHLKKENRNIGCYCLLCFIGFIFLNSESFAGTDEWRQATAPRVWNFPRDHGSHPEYKTEWWYFTGNLTDETGAPFGYQLTFFRRGVRYQKPEAANSWDVRDIYLGHLAISDGRNRRFHYAERVSRSGPGLAGAGEKNLDVRLLNWSAKMDGTPIHLKASSGEMALDLSLVPQKPPVIHGENGLSRKGPQEGQASYYTSSTRLETKGFLKTSSSSPVAVKGLSWFDQEFGSNQLTENQQGWDWFSLHLSDGRDLMLYLLRRRDGSIEPASSGTLVEADGRTRHLERSELSITIVEYWKSPHSGGRYPARWKIAIPALATELTLAPYFADQELVTGESTGVTYWEGAVSGQGTSRSRPVSCQGYVELTGYAGSLGSLF